MLFTFGEFPFQDCVNVIGFVIDDDVHSHFFQQFRFVVASARAGHSATQALGPLDCKLSCPTWFKLCKM